VKKIICAVTNIFYAIVCFLFFMIQNGQIVLPGTTEEVNFMVRYTDTFQSQLELYAFVVAVAGIGVIVFDFFVQKELIKINKTGCILALCIAVFSTVFLLVRGMAPITCLLGVVFGLLMIIPIKE